MNIVTNDQTFHSFNGLNFYVFPQSCYTQRDLPLIPYDSVMLMDINYQPMQGLVSQDNRYATYVPASPLSHWVQSFWQLNVPNGQHFYRSIPDNCVDVIINLNRWDDIFIVTPYTLPIAFELAGPESYFGIRFRVLGHQSIVAAPISEWQPENKDSKSGDVLPVDLLNRIYDCLELNLTFKQRCDYLTQALLSQVQQINPDPRLAKFVRYCCHHQGSNVDLTDKQCAQFGISARQLRRLSQLYLGVSPREFARVMRFQKVLRLMSNSSNTAPWLEHYYDQPHFIHEFKRLAGVNPSDFLKMSVLYNKD